MSQGICSKCGKEGTVSPFVNPDGFVLLSELFAQQGKDGYVYLEVQNG